jgi:hypothetical protein
MMHHRTADLGVVEVTAALRGHRTLALQRRIQQRVVAGLDARRPGTGVTELGRTRGTRLVAGRALGLVDVGAGAQRLGTAGVLQFEARDRLDARLHRFGRTARAARAVTCARGDELHQQHDDQDRHHEGQNHDGDELLGVLMKLW